jgi:hypothetical protein
MQYTITEMRRYYFISEEKKLKEKGISVILLMPFLFQN